jgi:hypothetical protein
VRYVSIVNLSILLIRYLSAYPLKQNFNIIYAQSLFEFTLKLFGRNTKSKVKMSLLKITDSLGKIKIRIKNLKLVSLLLKVINCKRFIIFFVLSLNALP